MDNNESQIENLFEAPPLLEQERMLEAILFSVSEPISKQQLEKRMPIGSDVSEALVAMKNRYSTRGVNLVRVGEGYALRTAPGLGFLMQKESVETRKLSRAAIETLAIIAYHQPVTRSEIEEIRGVSVSSGTIDILLELEWIKLGRRRQSPGRPVTFIVTQVFLDHFGMESSKDLPGIKELRDAGLLDNRPPPGSMTESNINDFIEDDDQEDMFE
ncbi:SMC-Scp complex subunit ScpB [Amylibacter sp.]|jgi:segregation and condensation protein B|nr:segregation and condensation protein B [alpha proteobacterium HTCC2255] [Rhodobacterales bacterium HTCC2255]MBT4132938.1 SMC-Scp complex subunit ScpB [Rhodobacterales bacterium]MDA9288250.1 SMC-Scp complex subunit ScpB [Amylibacter sp.]MBT6894293.1 SMC-Scp complex subunit ScpB [Rhodobacterales bacterium]MBT7560595.1 SMC-Scp complex subunit ScpB [Rhodobacterales bacterium]|tara:strand:+ start:4485 stop:5129 length:645 start_codon:yes stop_codon:yes gene_type:complete